MRSSVEEALIEMYLAGVSVRGVEDITKALWGSKVSPVTINEQNKIPMSISKICVAEGIKEDRPIGSVSSNSCASEVRTE